MTSTFEERKVVKLEDIGSLWRKRSVSASHVPLAFQSRKKFRFGGVGAAEDAVEVALGFGEHDRVEEGDVLLRLNDEELRVEAREADDDAPFAALAFKIATDPFVGTLTFFRVYSGKLESGTGVYNSVKEKKERVGRMVQMHSNSREEIKEVLATMGLHLGMEVPNWPPDNIEELAKRFEDQY